MNEYLVERYENDTHKLEIHIDIDSPNPREDFDGWLGTIVGHCKDYIVYDIEAKYIDHYDSWIGWLEGEILDAGKTTYYLPVFAYIHSGIALSTNRSYPFNDRWDSGQVGWIYCHHDDACKNLMGEVTEERVLDLLEAEVQTFNQWLNNNVYGFMLFEKCNCSECGDEHDKHIDSCWGFYGPDWEDNGLAEHLPDIGLELLKEPSTI